MFFMDGVTVLVFVVVAVVVYLVLDNHEFSFADTTTTKVIISLGFAALVAGIYSGYISEGSEELLKMEYDKATSKFGQMSGLENYADIV